MSIYSIHNRSRRHSVLAVLFVGVAADAGADPVVVDRVVAAVNGSAITERQRAFETRILLVSAGAPQAARTDLDAAALRGGLETMINERLLVAGATRTGAIRTVVAEADQLIQTFVAHLGSQAAFDDFVVRNQVTLAEIREVLVRHTLAARELEGQLRLRAMPSENEVRAYSAAQSTSPEAARAALYAQRMGSAVREYLDKIRQDADIRILATPQ